MPGITSYCAWKHKTCTMLSLSWMEINKNRGFSWTLTGGKNILHILFLVNLKFPPGDNSKELEANDILPAYSDGLTRIYKIDLPKEHKNHTCKDRHKKSSHSLTPHFNLFQIWIYLIQKNKNFHKNLTFTPNTAFSI